MDAGCKGMDTGYYLRVLGGMRLKRFWPILARTREISGRGRVWLTRDMLRCAARYGAGYHDYLQFGMYALTDAQRATMVTRVISRRLVTLLNNRDAARVLNDKAAFARVYAPFLRRDVLALDTASDQEIRAFLQKHPRLFCKPRDGERGVGCFILEADPSMPPDELRRRVRAGGADICEEILPQHPAQARFNPAALNCLRIVTLVDSRGEAHVIYAVQKFGIQNVCVDNAGPGNVCCRVDLDTGVILWPGVSGNGCDRTIYVAHPTSRRMLLGYQVPYFREACELCLAAAMVTPALRYVGWDVGITPDGPAIVEGNDYTDYMFYQHVPQTPDGIGMLPVFKKYVPEFES